MKFEESIDLHTELLQTAEQAEKVVCGEEQVTVPASHMRGRQCRKLGFIRDGSGLGQRSGPL